MPLLDHFHPLLSEERHWESFRSAWVGSLADALNRQLPAGYFAEEQVHAVPNTEDFEVQVFSSRAGPRLVAVIELVSPGNKDRPEKKRASVTKCASYLHQGIGLIVVDIVTDRHANLHNQLATLLHWPEESPMAPEVRLYAVAYRPLRRGGREEIDLWPKTLTVNASLPVLPLSIMADLCLRVDLDATYQDACQRRQLG